MVWLNAAVLTLLLAATFTVEIAVYERAELPPGALARALAEVDRLFDPSGVRFVWQLSASEPSRHAIAAIIVRARPERPVISGCSRNLHDHRLGRADLDSRQVTLWTEQVARAVAGRWGEKDSPRVDGSSLGTALGRVLAHELGHLFLRLDGHRESGLMKPSFTQRALTESRDRSFRFSARDLESLREAVSSAGVLLNK